MKIRGIMTVVLAASLILLAGCWNSRELRDMGIVIGMGIDKPPETNGYRVTFQIVNPAAMPMGTRGGGGQGTPVMVINETDSTLFGALRKASQKVSRRLFFGHIQLVVVGEPLARAGIQEVLDFLERAHEFRLTSTVLVSKGSDAEAVLQILTPLESSAAGGLKKRSANTNRLWGHTVEVEVIDVINALAGPGEPGISGIRIVGDKKTGGSQKVREQTKPPSYLVIKGITLFRDGKLVGWLEGGRARGVLWAQDKMKGTIVNVKCDGAKGGIAVELVRSQTSVKVRMERGKPVFRLRIREEGNVSEVHCPVELATRDSLAKVERRWADATKKEVMDAVKAAQSGKSDVLGFGTALSRTYPKLWKNVEKDWPELFADSKVEVEVEAFIRRTGMRVKSYIKEESG